ncbi:hypothetical protein BK004_04580 [bacterium CG10_46_32]|nr:MAG: hypothetical protein BK004_04580 [bacterium CG10_46_32]PIR55718.1 MAG: hypothetical protein COU73_04620 [Parcubacteria group bacterium CG10_big_fil_rev_8_21_14_0_10_46_32]
MDATEKLKVGYLGAATDSGPDTTTFGFMAAKQFFAATEDEVNFVNLPSHGNICKAVGKQEIRFGVVAVENVIDGMVNETVRAIEAAHGHWGVHITGETVIPIELFYLSKDGNPQPTVVSHEKASGQCSRFVNQLKDEGIAVETRNSTGEAAYAASQNGELACIASSRAEQVYGLNRINNTGNIVDNPNSMTRFWIISKEHGNRTGHDKSCFLINLEQAAVGALYRTLECFARHRCNLLIAYPISIPGKLWEYTFLLEFEGHINDDSIDGTWEELRNSGLCLNPPTFLGSYPSVTTNITVPA